MLHALTFEIGKIPLSADQSMILIDNEVDIVYVALVMVLEMWVKFEEVSSQRVK